jgi:hypothetical protein
MEVHISMQAAGSSFDPTGTDDGLSEYKHIGLGLIFPKYISGNFAK